MTFVPNGKRRSEIRVLPKMEEQCLILAHFCPVSSTSQATSQTSQRKETSAGLFPETAAGNRA